LARGKVVVFQRQQNNVKRLFGLPGDTVHILDGQIHVNRILVDTFHVIPETTAGSSSTIMEVQKVYNEPWNSAQWGPFIVPYKGMSVPFDAPHAKQYFTLILREWNSVNPDQKLTDVGQIPGLKNNYTFKEDHYFLVGDNRVISQDSRAYGPLTENACRGVISQVLVRSSKSKT